MIEKMGISNVTAKSDSVELIEACNAGIEVWSPATAILAECFLKEHLINGISFKNCLRGANQVAHF